MMAILNAFKAIFSNAAVLVGLMSFVGLVALKKPFALVVQGTLKTIVGFIILGAGAGVVVNTVIPLGELFNQVLNIPDAGMPVNEVFTAIVQNDSVLGPIVAWVFLFGFILNVVFARITRHKYIFLTGHHTLFAAVVTVGILSMVPMLMSNLVLLIVVCSLILGVMMVLFPAMSVPFIKKVIGSDDFVMGHFCTMAYVHAGFLGQFVGDPEKDSSEKINFPDWFGFMRDPLVAMGFVMLLFFLGVSAIGLGKGIDVPTILGGDPWWLRCFVLALTFAGGVGVILLGVRSVLAEIVPAFRGIAEKIVPNAKPALDCPVVFPYAQNALLIGYLSSTAGCVVTMLAQIAAGGALGGVILPSMITHFFAGGTAGIFGNATGGWKGAILGGFLNGVGSTLLAGLTYTAFGGLNPAWAGNAFADIDLGFIGSVLGFVSKTLR